MKDFKILLVLIALTCALITVASIAKELSTSTSAGKFSQVEPDKLSAALSSPNTVDVIGEIDFSMAENIIQQLRKIDTTNKGKPIVIRIVSPGGSVYAGLMIIDAINALKSPVITVCEGICASMGAVILSSGNPGMRLAMPNAMILVHSVSAGMSGTLSELNLQMLEAIRLQKLVVKMLSEQTGQDPEVIAQMLSYDNILTPEAALQAGFIDEIL